MHEQSRDRCVAVREVLRLEGDAGDDDLGEGVHLACEPPHAGQTRRGRGQGLHHRVVPAGEAVQHAEERVEDLERLLLKADPVQKEAAVADRVDVLVLLPQGEVVQKVLAAAEQAEQLVLFRRSDRQRPNEARVVARAVHGQRPVAAHDLVAAFGWKRQHIAGPEVRHREVLRSVGGHGLRVDAQIREQSLDDQAVAVRRLQVLGTAHTQHHAPVVVELVALRVPAKVVVVVEEQDASFGAHLLAVEPCGRQAADAGADDDQVVVLIELPVLGRLVPVPGKGVGHLEGTGVAAPHPGQCRRIVDRGCSFRGGRLRADLCDKLARRHQARASADGDTVQEVTACDAQGHRALQGWTCQVTC